MTLWYCIHCDRHFDTNECDHADYDRDMCENCVDKEQDVVYNTPERPPSETV